MNTLIHLLIIFSALAGVITLAIVAISGLKHCHPPRRKPDLKAFKAAAALALFCCLSLSVQAADSILSQISVSPVGAYKQVGFTTGPSEYGAGVDLGLPINKFVSIHVRNLAFEGAGGCEQPWGGSVIDETTVYGRADFCSFANEKFRLFGTGGGSRHWDENDWSFGLGLGAEYRFTKHLSASVSREIRARFKGEKDWLSTAALTWTF